MSDPEEHKRMVGELFSRAAQTYDTAGPRFFGKFGRRLVELAQPPAGGALLDVACGRGAVLLPAAEQIGPEGRVLGVDMAEGMVARTAEQARERGLAQVELRRMDAEQLDLPDASFDIVTCAFGIFFFPSPERALAEFRRVLKPGGRLALSTWGDIDSPTWTWFNELLKPYQPAPEGDPPPARRFFDTPERLHELLEPAGFSGVVVASEDYALAYRDEEDWWATQWSHGRRGALERLSPEQLAEFKQKAFDHLQTLRRPEGIGESFRVLYTLATSAPV